MVLHGVLALLCCLKNIQIATGHDEESTKIKQSLETNILHEKYQNMFEEEVTLLKRCASTDKNKVPLRSRYTIL